MNPSSIEYYQNPTSARSNLAASTRPRELLLKSIAIHEAGHAIAAYWFGFSLKSVTIIPEGQNLGLCTYEQIALPVDEPDHIQERVVFMFVRVLLAGYAAQWRRFGPARIPIKGDLTEAVNLLFDYYKPEFVDTAVEAMGRQFDSIRRLFYRKHIWAGTEALATELMDQRALSGPSAVNIIESFAKRQRGPSRW